MKYAALILLALTMAGCTGVQSASLDVNPLNMTIGGTLVFKDGRWMRSLPPADRAVADPCQPARAIERDPCAAPMDKSIKAEVVELRGLRSITGPLVSSRGIARAVTRSVKVAREEEKETYRAMQEIHYAEIKRMDTIIHASSQSTGGRIRRAFTGTPCALPALPEPSTPVTVDNPVVPTPTAPQAGDIIVTPTPPTTSTADSGFIPPPAPKAIDDKLEKRLQTIEKKLGQIDDINAKLDTLMAAVKPK